MLKRREAEAPNFLAYNSLAIKLLKWEPQKTLDDMCRDSFRFIKNTYLIYNFISVNFNN